MSRRYDVRVNTNPVANQYPARGERIIEFSAGSTQDTLCGGLISFRIDNRGKVRVELYRLDDDVVVVARAQTAMDRFYTWIREHEQEHGEWPAGSDVMSEADAMLRAAGYDMDYETPEVPA